MVGEYMKKVMATKEKNNTKKHNTIKSNKIKEKFDKAALIRSAKNKKDFETMSMLVDFSLLKKKMKKKNKTYHRFL